jgi:uncharacterized protein YfaS (alpha-2-macroglobulin family)
MTLNATRTDVTKARKVAPLKLSRTYANDSHPGQPYRVGDVVRVTLGVHHLPPDGAHYLLVEDELPAGLVPINTNLMNEQGMGHEVEGPNQGWWGSSNEVTENGIIIPVDYFHGKYMLTSYYARVIAEGDFLAPPAHVELMYSPWLNARTGFSRFQTGQFLHD